VEEWKKEGRSWAKEYARSAEYFYRQYWKIPRHDPRVECMTPEEFELEAYAVRYYHEYLDELAQEEDRRWREEARAKLAEISAKELEKLERDLAIRREREAAMNNARASN